MDKPKLINQNLWRLLGIIFFNVSGAILGFIILGSASRSLSISQFGLLGYLTALLYIPGLISYVVQINAMKVDFNHPTFVQSIDYSSSNNRSRILSHFKFSMLIAVSLFLFSFLKASETGASQTEIFALTLLCFVIIFSSLFQGRYLSTGKFTEFHGLGFVVSIFRTLATILLFYFGYGIVVFFTVYALSAGLVGLYCLIKSRSIIWTYSSQFTRKFFKQALLLGLTAFCFQFDVIFSRNLISHSESGIYFAGSQLAKFICLLSLSTSLAFLPKVLNGSLGDKDQQSVIWKGVAFSFWVSFTLSVILFLLGPQFIKVTFGSNYHEASKILPYLLIGTVSWSMFLTRINLSSSNIRSRDILHLIVICFIYILTLNFSNSMEMIAASWSTMGVLGLLLHYAPKVFLHKSKMKHRYL
jgi:O-antigen/teichoic acid export membrane protein